jgi:hypothetical protein
MVLGDRRHGSLECIEVGDHVGVGPVVLLDEWTMAGTEAEEKPAGVLGIEVGDRRSDLLGSGLPDVHDAACDDHGGGGGKQAPEAGGQPGVEAATGRDGPVAQRL